MGIDLRRLLHACAGLEVATHVGSRTGERFCRVAHVAIVVAGRNLIEMEDGQTFELGPGDIFASAPGHDSVVLGDEPYESLHLAGVQAYAASDAR